MSIGKKIGIAFGVLILILCLGICCWYFYLLEYGDKKMTSSTINVGTLTPADNSQASKYVLTIDYKSNVNKNGLEMFDLKLSYFTDENREHIYSQGVQYVANTVDDSIEWVDYDSYLTYLSNVVENSDGYVLDDLESYFDFLNRNGAISSYQLHKSGALFWQKEYIAAYFNPFVDNFTTSKYSYQSLDDFDSIASTNPISEESYFLLQTGDDEYVYMQFKGDNYLKWEDFKNADDFLGDSRKIGSSGKTNYYNNNSIDFLAYQLYQSVQSLPAGTNGAYVFEFGEDMFKFFEANTDGSVGAEISAEDTDLVINRLKSYYTIYVTVSANGARNSNDSMFGLLHGSSSYSIDGSSSASGDYFQGQTVINVDVYDFDLVLITDNYYGLKLKQSFIDEYLPYANDIYISVNIDVSIIEAAGYRYSGILPDSGLSYFNVLETNEINADMEVA